MEPTNDVENQNRIFDIVLNLNMIKADGATSPLDPFIPFAAAATGAAFFDGTEALSGGAGGFGAGPAAGGFGGSVFGSANMTNISNVMPFSNFAAPMQINSMIPPHLMM